MTIAIASTRLVPGLLLAVILFVWLRRADYTRLTAGLFAAFALAQSGIVLALAEAGHSLWLAVGVAAIAASIGAFAECDDARRAILVGGSLAAVQVCDPMGGLIAAGMLPAAIAVSHRRSDPRGAFGLYTLLLFPPASTAVLLLYLAYGAHIVAVQLLAPAAPAAAYREVPERFTAAFGLGLVLLPAFAGSHRTARGRATLLVAAAVIASSVFDGLIGTLREPVSLIAAGAPLTVAAVAGSPRTQGRDRRALVALALSAVLSWGVLLCLQHPSSSPG